MSITNVGENAEWWQSMLTTLPWSIPPSFSRLLGFTVSMIVPDLLHVWNLGVARHVLGSTLKVILREQVVFHQNNIPERLAAASESLRRYAKSHRLHLRIKKLTRAKIGWKQRKYPELACSGYDSYVVGKWLQHLLQPHSATYGDILSVLWSSNKAISTMYASDSWFLTQSEKETVRSTGEIFTKLYMKLAGQAIQQHQLLWRVIPKMHLLSHIFRFHRGVNCARFSTWMDEDFLKKISKVLALTSEKTAQKRLLERWLLSLHEHMKKNLAD